VKADDRAGNNSDGMMLADSTKKRIEDLQRVLRQKMRIYPPALVALKGVQRLRSVQAKAAQLGSGG
jgi:hypothetical protein